MRKVLYKKWIDAAYIKDEKGYHVKIEKTGCFEEDFINNGFFHGWGSSFEELHDGVGNFTFAIVENSDGTIEQVLPKNIKFILNN